MRCVRLTLTLFAIFFLCAPFSAFGQKETGQISGRITDALSGDPLGSVNVFLSGTTRGAFTAPDGRYLLADVPAGHYQIVASRVDRVVGAGTVDLQSGAHATWDCVLGPRELRSQEVEIIGVSSEEWGRNLVAFRRELLGEGDAAESCIIRNPEVLEFRRDSATGFFSATTDSVVRIDNPALGYHLQVTLSSFFWDSLLARIDYTLYIQFRPMRARGMEDSLRWREERRASYRGSLRHFLRSAVARKLSAEGFYLTTWKGDDLGTEALKIILTRPDGMRVIATDDVFTIDYGGSAVVQRNVVRLAQGLVHIRPDGSLVEQQEFLIDPGSFWAMRRVGSMLPLEYAIDEGE